MNMFRKKSFMFTGETVKLVLSMKHRSYDAKLTVNGTTYRDSFNDEEPYDRLTHVFYFPYENISDRTELTLEAKRSSRLPLTYRQTFLFGKPRFTVKKEQLKADDNGLTAESTETETISDGVTYTHRLYKDKKGAPVHVFVTEADPAFASLYIGTPNDGYESKGVRETIPGMIGKARANGRDILAGVNADFFDMFGDGHPSGLCMKNGKLISHAAKNRAFIALTDDGSHIITDLKESPDILPSIRQAAAGYQMIVKDGKLFDTAPMEPFSFTRHPRTAAGIRKDGTLILMVVDGRIPAYSNGASLVDLARLMISFGADRAINMDGGGSSAMYTKNGEGYLLRSRPADLIHPKAKLIRKDFNSLLIEKKEKKA